MSDRVDDQLSGLSVPRDMDPGFRERLERALSEATEEGTAQPRWTFDRPREMRPEFRARLETSVVRGKAPRRWRKVIAGVAAASLVLSGVVVAAGIRRNEPKAFDGAPFIPDENPRRPSLARVAPNGPDALRGFASEAEFLRYVRGEALALTGPYGFGLYGGPWYGGVFMGPPIAGSLPGSAPMPAERAAPAAPAVTSSYSRTNIQEEGVDEPDVVKTDGRRVVFLNQNKLEVLELVGGRLRLRGSVSVNDDKRGVAPTGFFLDHDRVIVVGESWGAPPEARRATHVLNRQWTTVSAIDISVLSRPRVASTFEVEGSYVGARFVGGIIRLVVRSSALGPPQVSPTAGTKPALSVAETKNKSAIRRSFVGDWVPHFVVERRGKRALTGHIHGWQEVARPPGRGGVGMLTILTVDPDDPRPDNAVSVIGSGDMIYSSLDSLYVTTSRLDDILARTSSRTPPKPVTRIHKFDIRDPKSAIYVASGEVPGFLLNQFSMSERDGYLRVASTLEAPWLSPDGAAPSESSVTVLSERDGRLVVTGRVGHLGRGERIFSVRFAGPFGYVVTFRQIDPLFVIDLRTPSRPRLRGKLHVHGVSGYLHPLSDTLLLGVGRAATAQGATKGIQFSVFDVSDPDRPRRVSVRTMGAFGWTPVGEDHHSFLYWEPDRLMVVPITIDSEDHTSPFVGAAVTRIGRSGVLGSPLRLTHAGRPHVGKALPSITRSLVIGHDLITISEFGALVNDIDSLETISWVPFS
jgi:uncharacterized secreted protein with C-terminal beta-propeller domain